MSQAPGFFTTLKERQVIKTLVLYVAIAWGFFEIASEFLTRFGFADRWITLLLVFLLLGLPAALLLSWYFDVDRLRIHRETRIGRADWLVIGASLLLPVVGVVAVNTLVDEGSHESAEKHSTVAVLPFNNFTGDAALEYVADGVAEEILTTLTSLPDLDVSAMTQSFRFRGEVDVAEVARELGIAWLVRGSVRASGQQLRFSASVVDARNGKVIWSDNTDVSKLAIFRGQKQLSSAVVSALAAALDIEVPVASEQYTPDPEAYDLYLRGRHVWHRRGTVDMGPAVTMLAEATRIDPDFARAWSALASAYLTWPSYSSDGYATWRSSEDIALRAIEIAPELPEPYSVLAVHAAHRQEWVKAYRFFEESLRLNDKNATAHYWFGEHLASTGRYAESVRHMRRAVELDPAYEAPKSDLAFGYLTYGAFDLGASVFKRSWEAGFRSPMNWVGNFIALVVRERYDEARGWVAASPLQQEGKALLLRFIDAENGPPDAALADEIFNAPESALDYRLKIWLLARLGDHDAAMRVAESRLDNGDSLDARPLWGIGIRLYEHDRFVALMERLQLVDYWREVGWGDVCRPDGAAVVCDGHSLKPEILNEVLAE